MEIEFEQLARAADFLCLEQLMALCLANLARLVQENLAGLKEHEI